MAAYRIKFTVVAEAGDSDGEAGALRTIRRFQSFLDDRFAHSSRVPIEEIEEGLRSSRRRCG